MRASLRSSVLVIAALSGCDRSTSRSAPMPPSAQSALATTPPGPSVAPATTTPTNSNSDACSLAGTWRGTIPAGPFGGQSISWTFAPGGAWTGVFGAASLQGSWSQAGLQATLTDASSVPAFVACPPGQQGVYALTFAAGCAALSLRVSSDPCDGRRLAVDALSLTRS